MMNNSSRKGFTLAELIIIVAVIGILAAIVVASFMTVGDRAKAQADEHTVAAFNGALDSAKAIKKDLSDVKKVRDYLIQSGFSAERLSNPETIGENSNDKYCFVWDSSEEVVLMIRLIDNSVIYPKDYTENTNDGSWYFLDREAQEADCSDASFPSAQKVAREYFAAKIDAMTEEEKAQSYVFAAKIKMEYTYDGVTYPIVQNEAERTQTVYAIYNGASYGTSTKPLSQFTLIQGTLNNLYNTDTSAQAWIMKVLPIGESAYTQVEGLYANPITEETVSENIFRIYTRLADSIHTSGDSVRENIW